MDIDSLIAELAALREKHGGDCRVLWWDWEPDTDFDPADTQNVAAVMFQDGDVLLS